MYCWWWQQRTDLCLRSRPVMSLHNACCVQTAWPHTDMRLEMFLCAQLKLREIMTDQWWCFRTWMCFYSLIIDLVYLIKLVSKSDSSLIINTESIFIISFSFLHMLFLLIIRSKTPKYCFMMRITGNSLIWDAGTEKCPCDWLIIRIVSLTGSISSSTRCFTTVWHCCADRSCLSAEPPEVEEVFSKY